MIVEFLSLAFSVSLPFIGHVIKRQIVDKSKTQLWRWEVEKECMPYKSSSRWRPHTSLQSPWSAVYAAMGLASWLVWRQGGFAAQSTPLGLYGALLIAVYLAWPPAFVSGNKLYAAIDAVVVLGTAAVVALQFHAAEPAAGYLLLPFLGYTTFGALLLSFSLESSSTEVADQAQQLASVECFEKIKYPLPPQAAAAFVGSVSSVGEQREHSQSLQHAEHELQAATAAAAPSGSESAFAQPSAQGGGSADVAQANQLLGKVDQYLGRTANESGRGQSTELLQTAVRQAQQLLTRVWTWFLTLLGFGPSTSRQVSSRLAARAEAVKSGGEVRALNLAQSISGAFSALRSPSGSDAAAATGARASGALPAVVEGGSAPTASPVSDSIPTAMFSCPGAADFKVRGPNYLQDKKKVLPDAPVCSLVSLNLVSLAEPTFHIARFLPSVRDSKAPLLFIWHVLVPGKQNYSLAITWALDHDPVERVHQALAAAAGEEAAASPSGRMEADGTVTLERRKSLKMRRSASAQDAVEAEAGGALDTETSAGSGASFLTDEGPLDQTQQIERSSKSLSSLKPDVPQMGGKQRHKRSQTVLDGSPPKALQPPSQPATPLRRSLWGSRAAATPAPEQEPAGPNPYTACDPFDVTMMRFLEAEGDPKEVDKRRHGAFKIIPRITEGSWVVKQAVGQNTPVLLGRKLTTKYFRGPNYIEVDVDVGSSRSAANVVGLVQGALKSLVIDLAVLLEGHCTEELPERLLGTCRLEHLDLSAAAHLELSTGRITRKDET
ncbi:probable translocator protein at N-terminal half [Coccomyxa sp. Obi]|nr:probable translocator protein at N-terminal half [Coccomyxa sp. Obi]